MQRSRQTLVASMLFLFSLSGQVTPITTPITQQAQRQTAFHLPIFLYHHIRPLTTNMTSLARGLSITPSSFEEQLAYLKQHKYTSQSLTALPALLEQDTSIPRNTFALTFDDGYEDLYTYAWPLLKKYGFHATAFIIINRVGTPDYATWDQIKEMDASGVIDIQSHTLNHPQLSHLTTEYAQFEIEQSKRILEERLGKKITIFCYPYGDYNPLIVRLTQKANYSLALTTNGGAWHSYANPLELSRVRLSTQDVRNALDRKMKYLFSQKTP